MQMVMASGGMADDRAPATAEQTLVRRARDGDRAAFEALIAGLRDQVLNLARRIVGDGEAAQDVAQVALLSAWRQLPSFRGQAAFGTWLYRITVNAARAHLRSERRRRARNERFAAGCEVASADVPAADGRLVGLLMRLPEHQRIALALFHLQELTIAEIAAVQGSPPGSVKARLARGRARLQKLAIEEGLV